MTLGEGHTMTAKLSAFAASGLLAYALAATPVAAQMGGGSVHDPRVSAARRGPPPGGIQRAPIQRGPAVNPNIGAPRVYRGPGGPVGGVGPGYRGPVVPRAGVGVVGPAYRGPVGPGYRG